MWHLEALCCHYMEIVWCVEVLCSRFPLKLCGSFLEVLCGEYPEELCGDYLETGWRL